VTQRIDIAGEITMKRCRVYGFGSLASQRTETVNPAPSTGTFYGRHLLRTLAVPIKILL
jgi:hypothetical protein